MLNKQTLCAIHAAPVASAHTLVAVVSCLHAGAAVHARILQTWERASCSQLRYKPGYSRAHCSAAAARRRIRLHGGENAGDVAVSGEAKIFILVTQLSVSYKI